MGDERWYEEGLRFACTQCGHCCTIEGYVWVDRAQMQELADYLEIDVAEFARRYVRRVGNRWSLTEKPDHACIFWDRGCTVYPARPRQCRTFPFWKENLATPERWAETTRDCPGADDGRIYHRPEIDALAAGRGATQSEPQSTARARERSTASADAETD